jgi:hypothetical protein
LTAVGFVTCGATKLTDNVLLVVAGLSLVEETFRAAALVRLAFLLALRLLIRDFFWIDIACSSILLKLPTDVWLESKEIAKLELRN